MYFFIVKPPRFWIDHEEIITHFLRHFKIDETLDEYLSAYEIFEQGVEQMQSKNWEEAVTAFKNSIEINPNHTQPYGNLGICYSSLGKKQLALDSFDKAIELDPNYEPALVNRKIAESLREGEPLGLEIRTIEYYKEYPLKNRSYIKEFVESQGLLPEKPNR